MGINNHAFNFLEYASRKKPLGSVLTLGKVGFHVARKQERRLIKPVPAAYFDERDGDRVLREVLGCTSVASLDISDFEGADIQHDLNLPVPESLHGRFESVLDLGTSEHVYQISQVFENVSTLVKPGGQIIHMLPANGQCGHGFWQFSPELFYSLYAPANGYRETEVFIADNAAPTRWIAAARPGEARRVNLRSMSPLFALVRTVRTDGEFSHAGVQQSDYEAAWSGADHNPKHGEIAHAKWGLAGQAARRLLRMGEILGAAFHYDLAQWQRHSAELDLSRLRRSEVYNPEGDARAAERPSG